MKYSKIDISASKLQIGVDKSGKTFLRFTQEYETVDLVVVNDDALAGLKFAIENYLEEMTPKSGIH